ncbi:hypothetical protein JTB14_004053 [Gonioctena quinquepunctata]|nr:hypothetical protein JTB14_004053 [Gonioctena quinquepunctata]
MKWAVKNNEMGWLMASKKFGDPQATLMRHALKENKSLDPNTKGMGRAATVQNAVNGFKKTGLFPDHLFEPAETTNIPLQLGLGEVVEAPLALENPSIPTSQVTEVIMQEANTYSPATSQAEEGLLQEEESLKLSATQVLEETVTSKEAIHGPSIILSAKRSLCYWPRRKKPFTKPTVLLLTSTLNMEEAKAKSAPTPDPKKKTKKVTKSLNFSSSSEEDFMSLQTNTANDEYEDYPYIYCNDLFSRSKPKEVWLKFMSCKR